MSCHKPKPDDKSNYVGIEIEFFCKYNYGYVKSLVEADKVLSKFCKLGEDGSIKTPWQNDGSHELRILSKRQHLKTNLLLVSKFLSSIGAEVNNSCGLHVHLDARNYDAKLLLENLKTSLKDIESSVPPSRLRGEYCKSVKRRMKSMLKMIDLYKQGRRNEYINTGRMDDWGNPIRSLAVPNYLGRKYSSINIECMLRYKTIEIRCHEGTVNCAEIYKWCDYLCEVAYGKEISKRNAKYIQNRIKTKGSYQAKRIA